MYRLRLLTLGIIKITLFEISQFVIHRLFTYFDKKTLRCPVFCSMVWYVV